jgi:hypothetical protein
VGFSPCVYFFQLFAVQQRLKPESGWAIFGTTEVVPHAYRLTEGNLQEAPLTEFAVPTRHTPGPDTCGAQERALKNFRENQTSRSPAVRMS